MSAQSIARWNAIPMTRPEDNGAHSLKRPSDNEEDDADDGVSLISHSPSLPPPEAMDIDKYDEYHRGTEREVVTVETKIKPTNKGFAMLAKLGWTEGQPLGLSGDGRVDPVPFYIKNDLTGLGKSNQDVRMIETTVSQRRELDSERQTKETEEQRKAREDLIAKRAAVHDEVSAALRPFYCELCDKQFQNVAQYDEHTNSYAHHHKSRFRDMQMAQRANLGSKEELDKRKEKERKREEKELRKLAKAAGIKFAKPLPTSSKSSGDGASSSGGDRQPLGSQDRSDETSTAHLAEPSASVQPVPVSSTSGWASLGSTSDIPSRVQPRTPASGAPSTSSAPAFRTGGWSSLDTTNPAQLPTAPPPVASQPSPPPFSEPVTSAASSQGGWSSIPTGLSSSSPLPTSQSLRQEPMSDASPSPSTPPVPRQKTKKAAERQESARSGWQQFRSAGRRK